MYTRTLYRIRLCQPGLAILLPLNVSSKNKNMLTEQWWTKIEKRVMGYPCFEEWKHHGFRLKNWLVANMLCTTVLQVRQIACRSVTYSFWINKHRPLPLFSLPKSSILACACPYAWSVKRIQEVLRQGTSLSGLFGEGLSPSSCAKCFQN